MVSDVTRMGEWSPVCKSCWWDEGDGPRVGAWFTGHNEQPERTWDTRCEVIAADPGREFTFVVGGAESPSRAGATRSRRSTAAPSSTESWQVMPALVARFAENFDDGGAAALAERTETAQSGMAATLAAIKAAAERG